MAKKPTKADIDKMKARINNPNTPENVVKVLKKVLAKVGEDVEDVVEDVEKEEKKVVKKVKKAVKKATTKKDYDKAKADLKKKTGKSQEECEEIIEQYKSLRAKAQSQKKKQTATKQKAKKRVDKLKSSDDVIKGTATKKADKVLEDTAKKVEDKIEKEIEAEVKQEEKEIKKKVEKEVSKDTTKTTPQKKAEVKKKVEEEVKEVKKKATKKVVTKVVVDTKGVIEAISQSLAKFDKEAQKEYLIKLRSDIDKMLKKYMFGGLTDGAVANMNVTQSQMSAESVNPQLYAKGGGVRKFSEGGYNGWTNYATWKVSLEMFDGVDWEDYYQGEPITSDVLESFVDEALYNNETARIYADDFLQDVNYDEISENINDRFDLEDGEKEEYAKGGGVRTNSKVVREAVRQHILDSVDDDGEYFDNINDASTYMVERFTSEFDNPYERRRTPNNQERFQEYLGGLPFSFHYYYDDVEDFLNKLGINPDGKKYSDEQMMRLYSYLIWREINDKYRMAKGGDIMTADTQFEYAKGGGVSDSDYKTAYKIGIESYKNNNIKAPAQDKKLLDFIYKGKSRPHKEQIKLMEIWTKARYDETEKIMKKEFPELYAKGGRMEQGYNDRMDESLGMRHRGRHSQSHKDRRDEAKGMNKAMGRRAYQSVGTMDMMAKGGRLYDNLKIDKGAFTREAEKRKTTPKALMNRVLSNPSRYSEKMRKQAQLMKNMGN